MKRKMSSPDDVSNHPAVAMFEAVLGKMKHATCISAVPECLSPIGKIAVGSRLGYSKIVFRNGEHHLKLSDGSTVPACFFDIE